ncbi:YcjF family protein [Desulfovibrio legallii]|uniref:Uncharacterized conserved protein, DUF697 family n=1 Tax=Desulfovibrio legallii TaxID=571438 RepID=A0A1G7JHZ3_9BACT|nr:DUF697 domain-containing protein [Desulfovibrio legallii]SDF24531.1 Uncharacterized conserved protein, DUF697 family [Desulfovibrio legallii]
MTTEQESKIDGTEEQSAPSAENAAGAPPTQEAVDALIRKRVYGAIGIGFVPVPLVDFLGLTALQLEMVHALTKAYGLEFKKERAKSIISSLLSGVLTTACVPLAASLFKSIPVVGYTAGAASISILGGATTYALGRVFDRHFRKGGNLVDFNAEEAKTYFKDKVEEGKSMVGAMKKKFKKAPEGAAGPVAEATVETTAQKPGDAANA